MGLFRDRNGCLTFYFFIVATGLPLGASKNRICPNVRLWRYFHTASALLYKHWYGYRCATNNWYSPTLLQLWRFRAIILYRFTVYFLKTRCKPIKGRYLNLGAPILYKSIIYWLEFKLPASSIYFAF